MGKNFMVLKFLGCLQDKYFTKCIKRKAKQMTHFGQLRTKF